MPRRVTGHTAPTQTRPSVRRVRVTRLIGEWTQMTTGGPNGGWAGKLIAVAGGHRTSTPSAGNTLATFASRYSPYVPVRSCRAAPSQRGAPAEEAGDADDGGDDGMGSPGAGMRRTTESQPGSKKQGNDRRA